VPRLRQARSGRVPRRRRGRLRDRAEGERAAPGAARHARGALAGARRARAGPPGHARDDAAARRRDEGRGPARGGAPHAGGRVAGREGRRGSAQRGGEDPERDPVAPARAPPDRCRRANPSRVKPDNSDNFLSPVWWADDRLMLVDQRLLPAEELDRAYGRWEDVADAIRTLVVRGAPAIGVAAAFGVALAARQSRATTFDALLGDLEAAVKGLEATRPVMQGSRLTAWECAREGIPHTLIADVVAASLMARGQVDLIVTGADRIAANGDTANKIGTYALAVLGRHHRVPFYVAAPFSTIDPALASGEQIPIEERDPAEVRRVGAQQTAPATSPVFNPAFDVTPAALITAIITERGVFR